MADTVEPGWLDRQVAQITRDADFWPNWMRRDAGLPERPFQPGDPVRARGGPPLAGEVCGVVVTKDGRDWYAVEDGDGFITVFGACQLVKGPT